MSKHKITNYFTRPGSNNAEKDIDLASLSESQTSSKSKVPKMTVSSVKMVKKWVREFYLVMKIASSFKILRVEKNATGK